MLVTEEKNYAVSAFVMSVPRHVRLAHPQDFNQELAMLEWETRNMTLGEILRKNPVWTDSGASRTVLLGRIGRNRATEFNNSWGWRWSSSRRKWVKYECVDLGKIGEGTQNG